jgi:hypothetical protein
MIGIHLLARAGKAGVYFALTILVVAIDLLLSVLVGTILSIPWWEELPLFAIPSVIVVAVLARWILLPREQLS